MLEVQVLAMWMGERGAVWRGTKDPGLPGGGTTEVRELQEEKEPRCLAHEGSEEHTEESALNIPQEQ